MSKRQTRKRINSIISVVLATVLLVSIIPSNLVLTPNNNYNNVSQADAASATDAASKDSEEKKSEAKDSEKKNSESKSVSLKKGVLENDDIIVEGMLPVNAVMETEEVDITIDGKEALIAYDINIYEDASAKKRGDKWQPEDDPLTVTFKAKSISADSVDVYHLEDEKSPAELVEENVSVDDNQVEFEADSFSIYAIVDHEGDDDIKTPRFTIHFLAPVTDTATQESVENGEYFYTVKPYEFKNKSEDPDNNKQTTQIIQDGETLEMISNPPNFKNVFFFGWYVVNPAEKIEHDEGEADDQYKYSWPESPKKINFDIPISVTDNGDKTFTMTWTIEGKTYSETAEYDPEDYSAHIYVAPIYEDYCFVNFHELAYAVSSNSNLLTRKLVILGSDETEKVLISDVTAQATDTIRKIFRGWQYRTNNSWISVQTMNDNGNPITKYIDVTGDTDLYPYFQEGRWLYFNVGDSGNGAKYVPAQFTLAEFDSEGGSASIGGTVTTLPTTERQGYDFAGWRVITGTDPNTNEPVYELVTDEDGNFLNSVNLSVEEEYEDNDGNTQTGVAYTISGGKLTIKYPLSSLTFYAQWDEKPDTHYTVVIWKQKVTDDPDIPDSQKTYDYYNLDPDVLPSEVNCNSGLTLSELDLSAYLSLSPEDPVKGKTLSDISKAFIGFHPRTNNPAEMSDTYVRGDGSTVVNIYYDRVTYDLKFLFARRALTGGNETGNFSVPYLSGNRFTPPNQQTWQAYCTTANTGMGWGNSNTTQLSSVCGYNTANIITEDYSNNRYYFYVIHANYGQDISTRWPDYDMFPRVNNYTLASWWMMSGALNNGGAGQNDTVKGKVSTIDKQIIGLPGSPDGNFLIASYRTGTINNWTYNIYLETLPDVDYSGETIIIRNGITYYLADQFTARSSNTQANQQNPPAYDGFDAPERVNPSNLRMDFYYNRQEYTLTFDYNYPVAAGMPATLKSPPEKIPYQTILSSYDYKTNESDTTNAIRPSTSEIPDHYEFGGWYEDIHCTVPANFNTTMPAADKIVYGKWTPVYYNICIDPNGGVIDHINYNETTDGGYPTFYVNGIDSGTGAEWDAARAANDDTSWASVLSTVGSGHNTSQSTYFSAMYGTAIGQYELERTYVEYNGTDDDTKYYYVNMQYNNNGEWGLHADMRNALYLTEAQLKAYYEYCRAAKAWHDVSRPGYYDGTLPDTFDAFKELYVKKNSQGNGYQLYEEVPSGSYAFVGWYTVDQNGNLSDTPYSFSNAVEESITLRAIWRRVGSYFIAYDPTYILTLSDNSTVLINGEITAWTDPANSSDGKYNDGATTTTLQQPTGITANGSPAEKNYIFRGWEVVDYLGKDANNHPIYSPIYNNVYYAEPTTFIINSADADVNGCIHMRAVYQAVNESDRRPEIANLMLNANDGILVSGAGSSTAISSDIDITTVSGWTGAGVVVEDASENEIVFGNMQSNNAVHVYKYAVTPETLDAPYDQSENYFKHNVGYLLIGFDEGSDYSLDRTSSSDDNLKTGEAFIPTYAADSVISVQRTDEVKLYAVWEPMVYVDFTNRTSQPVTFDLSGTGEAMSIVNERTGIFSREKFTEKSVTLQPGETIKFVMPKGAGETFTISGTNKNTAQLLNVTSEFHDAISASATASFYRSSGADYTLSDVLRTDPDGVHVYFDGIDTIFFDVNGTTEKPANWTDTRTGSSYSEVTADPALVYVDEDGLPYEPVDLNNNNTATATKPSDPTRTGYTFVGWTADPDVATCDPAGYTLPGTDESAGINNMTIIKRDKLWDFDTEVSAGMTLYAVWGENVTVTFHLTNNHTWHDTDNEYYVPGYNYTHTVTLAKGDTVRMPEAPTWNTTNQFYRWIKNDNSHQSSAKTIDQITNVYEFGSPVLENIDLYTSWTNSSYINVTISKTVKNGDGTPLTSAQSNKSFSFTAEITTTTYDGTIVRSNANPRWTESVNESNTTEIQSFTLKDGETITLPLYFDTTTKQRNINNNGTYHLTRFFQSVKISEISDPNYDVTLQVDNQLVSSNIGIIDTIGTTTPSLSYTGNRTYTLSGSYKYNSGASVSVDYTNTLTKTDVKLTKVVEPDDYITGNESFEFSVSYKDSENHDVTVPAEYATASLKDGESVILRGVPIGGSITVTENAPEWTATSANTNTGANSEREFTGTDTITVSNIPSEGDEIVFTNKRNMNIIAIQNKVDPDEPEYRNTTKPFTYTAILKNTEGEQVAFPSASNEYNPIKTTQGVSYSFSNERKVLTFALKHDESLAIHNLPNGYYIEVTQTEDPDYSTRYETNGTIPPALRLLAQPRAAGDTKAVVNSILDDLLIIFINTLRTSEVTVTKHVQLPSGITLSAGENTFNFTAKLYMTNNSTNALPITTAIENANPGVSVDHDAKTISFTLTVDEDHPELAEITLTHLPVGLYLQVVENAPKFAAYVNGMRTDAVKVQIAREDNSSIDYINRLAGATIKIQKVDKKTDKKLKDAVFRLNKRVNANNEEMLYELTSDANGWLAYSETGEPVTEITLENGTYSLVEQTQPKGYKKLTDPITIVVDNTQDDPRDWITVNGHTISQSTAEDIAQIIDYSDDGVHTIKVKNEKQPIIVPTGVNVAFNVLSIAILLAFGVWLFLLHKLSVMRKRRELSDD